MNSEQRQQNWQLDKANRDRELSPEESNHHRQLYERSQISTRVAMTEVQMPKDNLFGIH